MIKEENTVLLHLPQLLWLVSRQASCRKAVPTLPPHRWDPLSYKFHSAPKYSYPPRPQRNSKAQAVTVQRGQEVSDTPHSLVPPY